MKISPQVPEKKFYKVLTLYGHGGDTGHVTQLVLINFHFLFVPKTFSYKIRLQIAQQLLRKKKFQFLYLNELWPRPRNDLDLEYTSGFIYFFSSLHLPIFRPQAAKSV